MLNALLQYQQPGIRIGTFTIYAYAIIIVCGMIAAFSSFPCYSAAEICPRICS